MKPFASVVGSLLLIPSLVSGFIAPISQKACLPLLVVQHEKSLPARSGDPPPLLPTEGANNDYRDAMNVDSRGDTMTNLIEKTVIIPVLAILLTALPAEAAAGVLPTALWAYAHYLSILVITGCLAAERSLVKADMSVDDEDTIVKIDLVYCLMAALLIGSGFARASEVSHQYVQTIP
jgi:hypothetical protein